MDIHPHCPPMQACPDTFDPQTRDALLALTLTAGFGPIMIEKACQTLGGPQQAVDASVAQLATVPGIAQPKAQALRRNLDRTLADHLVGLEKDVMAAHGVRPLFRGEKAYPLLLAMTPDPPPVLFVQGRLLEEDAVALGVVGSRKCTPYGREQADRLCAWCAQAGLAIISGGAYGIDAAAHRAALRVGGRTVIVLGSGIARPYPQDHIDLFRQAVEQGSAIVSEFPMNTPPRAQQFPRRNRIISGLSLGVLVIEAALRSGALITARLAAEDHNREVMALPGRIDSPASAGCHRIIRDGGATLVTNGQDILDALGETGQLLKARHPAAAFAHTTPPEQASLFEMNLSPEQRKIVDALDQPLALDQLAARTGLVVARIQADLTMLQIRGLVDRAGGKIVRKR